MAKDSIKALLCSLFVLLRPPALPLPTCCCQVPSRKNEKIISLQMVDVNIPSIDATLCTTLCRQRHSPWSASAGISPPSPVRSEWSRTPIEIHQEAQGPSSSLKTPPGPDSDGEHKNGDKGRHDSVPIQGGQVGSGLTRPLLEPLIGSLDPHHHASYENPTG